jgi:hypothetical protein
MCWSRPRLRIRIAQVNDRDLGGVCSLRRRDHILFDQRAGAWLVSRGLVSARVPVRWDGRGAEAGVMAGPEFPVAFVGSTRDGIRPFRRENGVVTGKRGRPRELDRPIRPGWSAERGLARRSIGSPSSRVFAVVVCSKSGWLLRLPGSRFVGSAWAFTFRPIPRSSVGWPAGTSNPPPSAAPHTKSKIAGLGGDGVVGPFPIAVLFRWVSAGRLGAAIPLPPPFTRSIRRDQ